MIYGLLSLVHRATASFMTWILSDVDGFQFLFQLGFLNVQPRNLEHNNDIKYQRNAFAECVYVFVTGAQTRKRRVIRQ